jgi:hypothetical protein
MSKFDIIPPKKAEQKKNTVLERAKEIYKINYAEKENIVEDTNNEITSLINFFNEKESNDVKKFKDKKASDNDTRFWFAVYFQDTDQKNEFLEKAGIKELTSGQYVDGLLLAEKLGIKMERKDVKPPKKFKNFKYQDRD